jgi:A/G-specific adenine glycosylase
MNPLNGTTGKKLFQQMADDLLNRDEPALHNQAMMEFGALLCKPKNPACGICPVRLDCYAFKHNATTTLPVKINKVKIRKRYFNYLLIKMTTIAYCYIKEVWAIYGPICMNCL